MPRHPPCALNNLATKMLASTVQFSRYGRSRSRAVACAFVASFDVRAGPDRAATPAVRPGCVAVLRRRCPLPQDPTACLRSAQRPAVLSTPPRGSTCAATAGPAELVSVPPMSTTSAYASDCGSGRPGGRQVLLRKEVIQPHLPVRLPCYDFVPIADPTFDSSLPKGWATGFGCYRLS